MKFAKFLLIGGALFTLGGCTTAVMDDFFEDVNNLVENGSYTEITNPPPNFDAPYIENECPQIEIVDELSSLSEFAGSMKESNLISRVNLQQVESSCSIQRRQVSVDLKLAFNGELGPKAKQRNNDKPFFSYPFFITVANQNDVILAKEVFAASMTYERNEDTHTYYENLRQLIPIGRADQARRYKIFLGFQLSPEQLEYNRNNMVPIEHASESAGADE